MGIKQEYNFYMPCKNTERVDLPNGFYHIYGRGAAKRLIFIDDDDRQFFVDLLKRYLGPEVHYDINRNPYPNFHEKIGLLTFCLMGTHFHLLLHQVDDGQISVFMKSLIGSYTMYFNRKHQSRGALLESRFRSSLIQNELYLVHLTRYIHLNPDDYEGYKWSSLKYYLGEPEPDWMRTSELIEIANLSPEYYLELMRDYESVANDIKELKLADSGESIIEKESQNPF